MRQRLISAAVLVPVVVVLFMFGEPWLTLGIALLAGLAAYEVSHLVNAAGLRAESWFAVGMAVVAVMGAWFPGGDIFFPGRYPDTAAVLAFFAVVVIAAAVIAFRWDPRTGFLAWSGNVLSALYPSLLVFAVLLLRGAPAIPDGSLLSGGLDAGRIWILILVLTVWSLDSAAYISGRYVPRGHFMNHISPNKTWSGAVGGTTAAVAVCTFLTWAAGQQPWFGVTLGLVIAVAAQAGDLAESMLKRAAGVKDSGSWIPGHGGLLDRVDSFLFAAPAMFVALTLMSRYFRA